MSYKKDLGANDCHKQKSPSILQALKSLNKKFIESVSFFLPQILFHGHNAVADGKGTAVGIQKEV